MASFVSKLRSTSGDSLVLTWKRVGDFSQIHPLQELYTTENAEKYACYYHRSWHTCLLEQVFMQLMSDCVFLFY